jgi:spermidine synthase
LKTTGPVQGARRWALWLAFFFSGASALGYQVVWSKMLAAGLGHEFRSVVTVVAAFFCGMALGALASRRFSVPVIESAIGVFGIASGFLIPWASERFRLEPWAAFVLLLPGTVAIGATFPAMAALSGRVPATYAANTFGGVVGCLMTAFWLMPSYAFRDVAMILAVGNFLAAALVRSPALSHGEREKSGSLSHKIGALFFLTGFVALAFETVGVRLLSQAIEGTVYSFAVILAVYLCGQAAGATLKIKTPVLVTILAAAILGSLWISKFSVGMFDGLRERLGDSAGAVLVSELLVAASVFLVPTILMGALFARLAERARGLLSVAVCWNSLGCAVGAVAAAVLYPNIAPLLPTLARPPLGQLALEIREGRMATVMVTEGPDGHRTLFVNNRFQMGGTAALIPELRQGFLPLLLADEPRRALFLGLGTGISLSAAAAFPDLRADGVELLPEVVEVMPKFFERGGASPMEATNISVRVADARRFIRETTNLYDVVVGELFHPAQDGAGFLYTEEHFRRIKARLTEYGLFCQWLPLHQLDLETFRIIARTFEAVFPEAEVYLLRFNVDAPVVGLVGWNRAVEPKLDVIESVAADATMGPELRRVALGDSVRVYGCLLADAEQLKKFAGTGELNTDAHPVVIFEAPRFSYLRKAPSYERLLAFMDAVGERESEEFPTERHELFARARDIYLRALVGDAKGHQEKAIDGYVESARVSEDFTSGYAQVLEIAKARSFTNYESARGLLERLIEAQPDRPVARRFLEGLKKD